MGPSKVVVHYADGKVVKGFAQDFSPDKDSFHLYANSSLSGISEEVTINSLKAMFFVRDFAGNPGHQDSKRCAQGKIPQGRGSESDSEMARLWSAQA